MLNRFENAISNRSLVTPPVAKDFPSVIEKTLVPGPTRIPTPALPKRPMLSAGFTNAALSKYASTLGLPSVPLAT